VWQRPLPSEWSDREGYKTTLAFGLFADALVLRHVLSRTPCVRTRGRGEQGHGDVPWGTVLF
jgi:hypothetical protein